MKESVMNYWGKKWKKLYWKDLVLGRKEERGMLINPLLEIYGVRRGERGLRLRSRAGQEGNGMRNEGMEEIEGEK